MAETCLLGICWGIFSLQWALSGAIVAATNQRCAWHMEIPSYDGCQCYISAHRYAISAWYYQASCYGISAPQQEGQYRSIVW